MAVIVITGGTAGVGKATALRFAKAGYDVGLIARDEASLHSTQEELRLQKLLALQQAGRDPFAHHTYARTHLAEHVGGHGPCDRRHPFRAGEALNPEERRREQDHEQRDGELAAVVGDGHGGLAHACLQFGESGESGESVSGRSAFIARRGPP